ncbi:MAG: DEAD/DEAH box helicase, partial [Ruminococcus sp.]|nr:DEAD/DEAH box helicase [Ruminococcus sp.]
LKKHMEDYIKTNYFGKNDELRRMCAGILSESLCQKPYIEANPAYVSVDNGISSNSMLTYEKDSLIPMSKKKLKVIDTPYVHQINALEEFHNGNDLFVATGTGSGKTECFMWPMVSSLMNELQNNPSTWQIRGIRALVLYPMNALVSDQLSRLRKMIGDEKGEFHKICNELRSNARYPQFGMYTGRTPYAGNPNKKKDSDLAKTLSEGLIKISDKAKESLKDDGKYPAKYDLEEFVKSLRYGEHITNENDAELITRQEMINNCPDILITNYSMLQYMLIRPIEQPIWDSTKQWLYSDKNNKILFIIDEAHMYKGSAGGEVALLIRRFMHKLGIDRSRLRFILTSASIPKNEEEAVIKFACDLSAEEIENNKFRIITGEQEKIESEKAINHEARVISKFYSSEINLDTDSIKQIITELNFDTGKCDWSQDESISYMLSDNLMNCKPMLEILKKCRGNATILSEIAEAAYPDSDTNEAMRAVSVLMALATKSKSKNGLSFFPARLHMFFRGVPGLYGCINPECPDYNSKIGIGKIFTSKRTKCDCGGKVFELYNDRSCGTVFLKGYYDTSKFDCIWSDRGISDSDKFVSVAVYLSLDGKTPRNSIVKWMNVKTGRLFNDDNFASKKGFVKVCFSKLKINPNAREDDIQVSFSSCPHCEKRKLRLTDFSTKGNEPFFHLVSEQLHIQQPIITEANEIIRTPNKGRKVLLFSDSRQTAAVLAKDLTKAADDEAIRKAFPLAALNMKEWCEENDEEPSLKKLYIFLLEICYKYNLRLFYGDDGEEFERDIAKFKSVYEDAIDNDNEFDYYEVLDEEFGQLPGLYYYHLLVHFCSNFRSFVDFAICWLEPSKKALKKSLQELEKRKVNITRQELYELLVAWINEVLTDSYALDKDISDDVRRSITGYERFGICEVKLPDKFKGLLITKFSDDEITKITDTIKKYFLSSKFNDVNYINPAKLIIQLGINHEWYKCERCGGIFPLKLYNKCARCGKGNVHLMDSHELEGLEFWRNPVITTLSGDYRNITGINTEEHTAQLSHKDQMQKMWSTTEDIERRFKNIYINNSDKSVDVLSSTTTMEVGIDIGSLTAVGLRNVPPMRENYQQRAGRAGRRGAAISTIITYVENRPHDMFYYENPDAIISGEPRTPWIDSNNDKLSERHISVICITDILESMKLDINNLPIGIFFDKLYDSFINELNKWNISDSKLEVLLPDYNGFNR